MIQQEQLEALIELANRSAIQIMVLQTAMYELIRLTPDEARQQFAENFQQQAAERMDENAAHFSPLADDQYVISVQAVLEACAARKS